MNVTLDEKALKYIHHFMDMLSSAFRLVPNRGQWQNVLFKQYSGTSGAVLS